MSRGRRVALGAAAAIAALGLIAGAGAWWVTGTRGGARWAFERLGGFFPGELQVGTMRGPLRGPLEIRGLLYRDERAEILVDRLRLDWRLRALALQRIDVRDLVAEGVHVRLFAPAEERAREDTLGSELPDVDLPLDLMVRRATLTGVEILGAGADSAVRLDRVVLESAAFRDTLSIGSLVVRGPLLDLDLAGAAVTRGRYGADMEVRWTWRGPGLGELRGRGRVNGDLDTLRLRQSLAGALRADLDLAVLHPLRRPALDGWVAFEDLELTRLGATLPEGRVGGRLRLEGQLDALDARGRLAGRIAEWGAWSADVDAARHGAAYRLRRVVLTRPGTRIELAGTVVPDSAATGIDLTARWTGLALPPGGATALRSASGRLAVSGTTERYRLRGEARLAGGPLPPSTWRAAGAGDPRGVRLDALAGDLHGAAVRARGEVGWSPAPRWRLSGEARGLDPGRFGAPAQGSVALDFATHGTAAAGGPSGAVEIERIGGAVRALPVAGRAAIRFAPGVTVVPLVDVAWGSGHLVAEGRVAEAWSFAWSLDVPDLAGLVPHGGGSLSLDGGVSGPRAHPRLHATIEGDTLRWEGGRQDTLAGTADLGLGAGDPVALDLEARSLQVSGRQVERLTLAVGGTRERHEVTLEAAAHEDSLRLAAHGGVAGGGWRGRLARLDLGSRALGSWALAGEAPVAASARQASLDDFCWVSGESRLCLPEAVWSREGGWRVAADLERLRLALLEPVLPPALDLEGPLSGTIRARSAGGPVVGEVDLVVGPGAIAYPTGDGPARVDLRPGRIEIDAGPVAADTRFALGWGAADSAVGRVRWPQPGAAGGAVAGDFHVRVAELGPIQGLIPALAGTRGRLDADLRLSGTAARPRWSGEATLAGGAAEVPELGLEVTGIEVAARADAEGRLRIDGRARSGPGEVTLAGEATLLPGGAPRAWATVQGSRFEVADTRHHRVLVTPELRAELTGDSLALEGSILIPDADVRLRAQGGDPPVRPSPDVVWVDTLENERRPRAPIAVRTEVRLTLGDRVHVSGYGLDARPRGSVLAIDEPGSPPRARGELTVTQGTYRAFGRQLQIERGRLVFDGGRLANPDLDVRATRRASDGVVAGFEVHGTLEAPQLAVFSDPPMAERDALAYILFGQRIDRSSELQQGIVADAANAIGLQGTSYVTGSIARRLGIEEAAIQSEGTFADASLMLGTYLSPRLYVNYAVGLLDPATTLRIQYFLSRKWTLQAETGGASSAQIFYTVER